MHAYIKILILYCFLQTQVHKVVYIAKLMKMIGLCDRRLLQSSPMGCWHHVVQWHQNGYRCIPWSQSSLILGYVPAI